MGGCRSRGGRRAGIEPRVALVHDLLDQDGGAERMLWTLHAMFPDAPIFTSVWNQRKTPRFSACEVRTSWMQKLPFVLRAPRAYAALYPLAFATMDFGDYDLVISLTTSFAKGIRTRPGSLHICYCNAPSNFIWRAQAYFDRPLMRHVTAPLRAWLRSWDRWAAKQPDLIVTSGRPVAARIGVFYGREAVIIHPPINQGWFVPHRADDFYLFASRLVPHKRADLAIAACAQLEVPLCLVGDGRARKQLQKVAGSRAHFLGRVSDAELRVLYASARALLVPAEEDFGLVALEAQAAGTPVIAYDRGGAQETVVDGVTGIRFSEQTVDALAIAMVKGTAQRWDRARIQSHAARFEERRFQEAFGGLIHRQWRGRVGASHAATG